MAGCPNTKGCPDGWGRIVIFRGADKDGVRSHPDALFGCCLSDCAPLGRKKQQVHYSDINSSSDPCTCVRKKNIPPELRMRRFSIMSV